MLVCSVSRLLLPLAAGHQSSCSPSKEDPTLIEIRRVGADQTSTGFRGNFGREFDRDQRSPWRSSELARLPEIMDQADDREAKIATNLAGWLSTKSGA